MQKQFAVVTGIAMLAVAGFVVTQNTGILQGTVTTGPLTSSTGMTSTSTGISSSTTTDCTRSGVFTGLSCTAADGTCVRCSSSSSSSSPTCSDKSVTDPGIQRVSRGINGVDATAMQAACDAALAAAEGKCDDFRGVPESCNPPADCYDEGEGEIETVASNTQIFKTQGNGQSTCEYLFQCKNFRSCRSLSTLNSSPFGSF